MKLDHILIPLNFSESSQGAIDCAAALRAKYSAAKITLMHVVEMPVVMGMAAAQTYADLQAAQLIGAKAKLTSLAISTASHLADRSPEEAVCKVGRPWIEICQWATENAVDLIIMPTQGDRGPTHAWIGSVAERVAQKAPCPVLVVRPESDRSPMADSSQNTQG